MVEIERKFLVKSNLYKEEAISKERISQGYLNSHPERTVRVRIKGDKGFLTIKGKSNATGLSRFEWEKEIPVKEAEVLIKLCEPGLIEKQRYRVRSGNYIFEIDQFEGENQGLVIAEIELESEDSEYFSPGWLGEEVTGDIRYYNSYLSKNPYKNWQTV